MSIDCIAFFDLNSPAVSPLSLSAHLAANPPALAEVVERFGPYWLVKSWTCEPLNAWGESELRGPGGFSFRFQPHLVEVYHMCRFSGFACDAEVRTQLRRVWRLVADLLQSPRAIYTHELMPHNGANLQQIAAALRSEIGPPADGFDDLCQAELFGPRAWYIDDFEDLRVAPESF